MARARQEAASGRAVTLIGPGGTGSDETRTLGQGELRILRIAAPAAEKGELLRRAAWAALMSARLLKATRNAARATGACETRVTGSPPFVSCLVLRWRKLLWRRKGRAISITCGITDCYPETAFAAGKARALAPIAPAIYALLKRDGATLAEIRAGRERMGHMRAREYVPRAAADASRSPKAPWRLVWGGPACFERRPGT